MNRRENLSYEMLNRVVEFGNNNAELFPKNSAAPEVLASIETNVKRLSEIAASRITAETAMRNTTKAREAARENLKNALSRANLSARALNEEAVRVPSKVTDRALINTGHAFAAVAEPLKKEFIKHGLNPEEVSAAVTGLEERISEFTAAKAAKAGAVLEWHTTLDETLGSLRKLDALVANTLRKNPVAVAAYETARAVPNARTRKAEEKPEAEAKTAAA